jgi:inorganic pyrophosphatase
VVLADGHVLGHVAAGLAEEPDGGAIDGLAEAGADEAAAAREETTETMTNYLELPVGPKCPEVVNAVIEIPSEGINKYEYDKELHVFRLDRNLYSPVHYPGDYGFIPSTLGEDGDPLDCVVLVDAPSFPGCVMEVRPIGVLEMTTRDWATRRSCAWARAIRATRMSGTFGDLPAHAARDHALLRDLQGP